MAPKQSQSLIIEYRKLAYSIDRINQCSNP